MVCDRVSVLKDGRLSGTRDVASTSTDELIRLMVGRDVSSIAPVRRWRGRTRRFCKSRSFAPSLSSARRT